MVVSHGNMGCAWRPSIVAVLADPIAILAPLPAHASVTDERIVQDEGPAAVLQGLRL